jgi:hypothetical protein
VILKTLGEVGAEGFKSTVWQTTLPSGLIRVFFIADFDVDVDGIGGNPEHDKSFQPDTTLHHNGKAINPYEVSGVVVPGWLPKAVGPIVLGCKARATNLSTMQSYDAVVHDTGPLRKDGEGTPYLAEKLGINTNPNTGGEDLPIILYEIFPGVPAVVDGVYYKLQPS